MTRCTITCCEHGCNNPIHYEDTDESVPLYCSKHRTETGRHAQVRILNKPKREPEPERVLFKCVDKKCGHTTPILKDDWSRRGIKSIECPKCGRKMLYHKDVKP